MARCGSRACAGRSNWSHLRSPSCHVWFQTAGPANGSVSRHRFTRPSPDAREETRSRRSSRRRETPAGTSRAAESRRSEKPMRSSSASDSRLSAANETRLPWLCPQTITCRPGCGSSGPAATWYRIRSVRSTAVLRVGRGREQIHGVRPEGDDVPDDVDAASRLLVLDGLTTLGDEQDDQAQQRPRAELGQDRRKPPPESVEAGRFVRGDAQRLQRTPRTFIAKVRDLGPAQERGQHTAEADDEPHESRDLVLEPRRPDGSHQGPAPLRQAGCGVRRRVGPLGGERHITRVSDVGVLHEGVAALQATHHEPAEDDPTTMPKPHA